MFNQIILIGRVGSEPQFTDFGESKNVRLRIATWRNVRDATHESGWRQVTQWHNVVVWGDRAEPLSKLSKGDMVNVVGELRSREYEDANGVQRITFEIVGSVKRISQKRHEPKLLDGITNEIPSEFQPEVPPVFDEVGDSPDDLPF